MPRESKQFSLTPMDFAEAGTDPIFRPQCGCLRLEQNFWGRGSGDRSLKTYRRLREQVGDVQFHTDPQDTGCDAWRRMLRLVDEAAEDRRPVFWPARELGRARARKRASTSSLRPAKGAAVPLSPFRVAR